MAARLKFARLTGTDRGRGKQLSDPMAIKLPVDPYRLSLVGGDLRPGASGLAMVGSGVSDWLGRGASGGSIENKKKHGKET